MRQELQALVVLRVNDGPDTKALANRYGIHAVPTLVFMRQDGREVDRIVGVHLPKKFLSELSAIKAGRTTDRMLAQVMEGKATYVLLTTVVKQLLEASRDLEAVRALEKFGEGARLSHLADTIFLARRVLQSQVYGRAVAALATCCAASDCCCRPRSIPWRA